MTGRTDFKPGKLIARETCEIDRYRVGLTQRQNETEITIDNDGWGFSLFDPQGDFLVCCTNFPSKESAINQCRKIIKSRNDPARPVDLLPVSRKFHDPYIKFMLATDQSDRLEHYQALLKHPTINGLHKNRSVQTASRRVLDIVSAGADPKPDMDLWRKLAEISAKHDQLPRSVETIRDWFKGVKSVEDIINLIQTQDTGSNLDELISRGVSLIVESIENCNRDPYYSGNASHEITNELVIEQFFEWLEIPEEAAGEHLFFWALEFLDTTNGRYDRAVIAQAINHAFKCVVSPA